MSYVPDSLNGLTKARVVGHRGDVENFIKYMHISWHCLNIEEIKEAELTSMSPCLPAFPLTTCFWPIRGPTRMVPECPRSIKFLNQDLRTSKKNQGFFSECGAQNLSV